MYVVSRYVWNDYMCGLKAQPISALLYEVDEVPMTRRDALTYLSRLEAAGGLSSQVSQVKFSGMQSTDTLCAVHPLSSPLLTSPLLSCPVLSSHLIFRYICVARDTRWAAA